MEVGILAIFYLIGSLPAAWIAGKMAGVGDIREQGSGNAGVMNVALNASRLAGLVVFLAEIGKAVITVGLARAMHLGEVLTALGVLAAVLGTRHSIWIGGKGGRGNTLIVASLTLLSWLSALIGLLVWVAGRLVLRSSYRATRLWLLSLPVTLGLVTHSWPYALMGGVLAGFFLGAHKRSTDDHTLLKESYPSLWQFLTAPRRPRQRRSNERAPLERPDNEPSETWLKSGKSNG